jgi:hypothetical protein
LIYNKGQEKITRGASQYLLFVRVIKERRMNRLGHVAYTGNSNVQNFA